MRTHRHPIRQSERGMVTLLVVFVLGLVFALSYSTLTHGLSERQDVERTAASLAALHLAEFGLAKAQLELQSQIDADKDGLGNVVGTTRNGGGFVVGSYETEAVPGAGDMYTLTAIGQFGLSVRRIQVGMEVKTSFAFRHAVFALDDLYIDSSVATDSYDSRDGSWVSQAKNNDSLGAYAEATGHVGSNADIDIYSSVMIRGDARSGPSSNTTIHGSSASVYGDDSAESNLQSIPIPTLEEFQKAYLSNNNAEISSSGDITYDPVKMDLRVEGSDTLQLSGGTYFFSDLEINSSATLIIDSRTRIYVTGDLLLTSSVSINAGGDPADLSIICHPYAVSPGWSQPSDRIELNSSLVAALTILAPARDIYMDSSVTLFGAVIGRKVEANSSVQVHYDRALGAGAGGAAETRRTYWHEPRTPTR